MMAGMYRHQGCGSDLYDAGPDLDPDTTFYFDADPDPDPTPSFEHVFYTIFLLYSQQCQFTLFIFLVRTLGVIILTIYKYIEIFFAFG